MDTAIARNQDKVTVGQTQRATSESEMTRIPAIVLGRGITVLGVIRALGRQKIPVYCIGPQGPYARRSRYHHRLVDDEIPDTPAALQIVLAGLPFERAVLIPCTDNWVRAVASLPESLKQRFPASISPLGIAEMLVDKQLFAAALSRHQVPHPLTIPLHSESDLLAVDPAVLTHGFLKPADSQAFGLRFKRKAFSFSNPEEAMARYREAVQADLAVILQEYIPGPPNDHYFLDGFCDQTGAFRGWFARRRLRMYPPRFGNSTYLVSVGLDEVNDGKESLERFLPAIGFRGVFSAEFKRDERDGRLKILEINGRPWWYVTFAVDCGVDVVLMAYRDALGLPVQSAAPARSGVHFVFPLYDGMACRVLRSNGELGLPRWWWQWLTAKQAVFAWYDPWPSCRGWIARVNESIIHHTRRLFGRTS
jgi:D-aspartate ligase